MPGTIHECTRSGRLPQVAAACEDIRESPHARADPSSQSVVTNSTQKRDISMKILRLEVVAEQVHYPIEISRGANGRPQIEDEGNITKQEQLQHLGMNGHHVGLSVINFALGD